MLIGEQKFVGGGEGLEVPVRKVRGEPPLFLCGILQILRDKLHGEEEDDRCIINRTISCPDGKWFASAQPP